MNRNSKKLISDQNKWAEVSKELKTEKINMKTKKEGGYEIIENHRPIEWYKDLYKEVGLTLEDIIFTPEYELNGLKIKDFIIFKLKK